MSQFTRDRSRFDGLSARCVTCGRVAEPQSTKGRQSAFKGRTHTVAAREAMSAARKGRPNGRAGKKHTAETKRKISAVTRERTPRGEAAPGYIDGKGVERRGLRSSANLKRWRYDVFRRDEFACAHCGDDTGGNLNAHHIRPFAEFPDLRFDVRNGITLCVGCHALAHRTCLWGYPQPPA